MKKIFFILCIMLFVCILPITSYSARPNTLIRCVSLDYFEIEALFVENNIISEKEIEQLYDSEKFQIYDGNIIVKQAKPTDNKFLNSFDKNKDNETDSKQELSKYYPNDSQCSLDDAYAGDDTGDSGEGLSCEEYCILACAVFFDPHTLAYANCNNACKIANDC